MTSFPIRAAAALLTTAAVAAPLLAKAQQPHEYRVLYPGLKVTAAQVLVPKFELSTDLVDFGNVATHTTETRQVLVSNTGTGSLTFSAAPFVTGDAAFATNYTACGEILGAGSNCLTDVTFSPTAIGSVEGLLTFSTPLAGSPHNVTLKGTAYNPVKLNAATLPDGMVGKAYSYDFKTLLSVSNESTPDKSLATWKGTGTLPTGLSFNTTTGVLSGTPSVMTAGTNYTVIGTYKNNEGQQVYTIRVGEAVLEVVQIAAGQTHICAVTTAGGAKCWGYNSNGQLGDGTTTQRNTPVYVSGLATGVAQVAVGSSHSCALTTAGGVKCWGANFNGSLGDNSNTKRSAPVNVYGLTSGVKAIGAADRSSCAITAADGVKCWGFNGQNQLGDGTAYERWIPTDVSSLTSGVASITVGNSSSCALTKAGAVYCWGGYLGAGPRSITGVTSGIASVVSGGSHMCAITTTGAGKCWGDNRYGQLGDGTTTQQLYSAVNVTAMSGPLKSIALGVWHTCVITSTDGVKCWGGNSDGQLGNGTTNNSSTAVDVSGLTSGVAKIFAGQSFTCAVTTSGAAKCWGLNAWGQLGDGTTTSRSAPVNVKP